MLDDSDIARLHHILDAMSKIDEALIGYSEAKFAQDWQKQLVIERLLGIIGEAAAHISPEVRKANEHVPWAKMVGMRNVVSHQYFRVDVSSV